MNKKKQIEIAVGHAQNVLSHYRATYLHGDESEKSIDNLREIAQELSGKSIEYYYHKMTYTAGQSIRAVCVAFDRHYEIALLEGQNLCWRRLVLAKEIFQVIIDNPEYRTHDLNSLVQEYMGAAPGTSPNPAALAESLSEFAAMEYLFPYTDRKILLHQHDNLTPDFAPIADRYKVPRVMVERYLSRPFMTLLA